MMNTGAAQYRAQQTGDAAAIVARHSELVRRIAHHLAARLPSSVEIDDLIQVVRQKLARTDLELHDEHDVPEHHDRVDPPA